MSKNPTRSTTKETDMDDRDYCPEHGHYIGRNDPFYVCPGEHADPDARRTEGN